VKRLDLWLVLTASCAEASRLASESLDRELATSERWALRVHTAICRNCRRFVHQIRLIHQALTQMSDTLRSELQSHSLRLSPERRREIKQLLASDAHDERSERRH